MDASTKPILVNRAQAEQVAQIFMRHPHIHGVELFGSVARNGQGHDLDLILVTDVVRGFDFIREVATRLHEIATYNHPWERMGAARDVLGDNFNNLRIEAEDLIGYEYMALDILVFPHDWCERLYQLQKDIPHSDPNFMKNIARDAVKIA